MKMNIIWNSLGNLLYLLSQWIITYSVTKILGFENAGILSLAMSLTTTFSAIALYGIRSFQVSDTKNEYNDSTYIATRKFTNIVAMFICSIFVLVNNYSSLQRICVISFMLFKISETLVDVYHGIDQLNMRMDIIGKSFLIRGFLSTIVFIVIIIHTNNLAYGIISLILSSFLIIYLYDINKAKQFYIKQKVKLNDILQLLCKCLPLAVYIFLFTSFTTIPRFFLDKIMGSELLGIYASVALPVLIVQVLATYIFNPFITIFADYLKNGDFINFKKLFFKISVILSILSITCFLGSLIFGQFGLKILFGDQILKYTYLLVPLVFCTILTAYLWFLSTIVIVIRRFKSLLVSGIIAVIVCSSGSQYFIYQFGLNGTSFITIICLLIQISIILIDLYVYNKKINNRIF